MEHPAAGRPAAVAGGEPAYLVEQGLEQEGHGANAALNALIADYLAQVDRYNDCPMRHTAVEAVLTETTGEPR